MQHNSQKFYLFEEGVAAVQAQAQKPNVLTDPKKEIAKKQAEQMSTRIAQMNVQLAKQKAKADIVASESNNVYRDLASAYVSMYEAKKKVDQDEDGDTDFADVRIARMIASGVPKEVAIAKTRNKPYNKEEFELDEGLGTAVQRLFGGKTKKAEAPKPMSRGAELRKRYNVTSSTGETSATGRKFQRSARLASADKAKYGEGSAASRESSAAHKRYVQAGASLHGAGELGLGQSGARGGKARRRLAAMRGTDVMSTKLSHNEEFETWVNSLLDEGYDLSDYTWEEMFDIYEETDEERKERRRARIRELESQGRVMTSSRATSEKARQRREQKRAEELERLANRVLSTTSGPTRRSKTPMGSEQPAPKQKAPESNRKLRKDARVDSLASRADDILRSIRSENYEIIASYLLENNFAETVEDANVIIENMSERWVQSILR